MEKFAGVIQFKQCGVPSEDGKLMLDAQMTIELSEQDARSVLELGSSGNPHPLKGIVETGMDAMNFRVELDQTVSLEDGK